MTTRASDPLSHDWLLGRYEVLAPLPSRHGVERFRGRDHGQQPGPIAVVIVRAPATELREPPPPALERPVEKPVAEDVVDLTSGFDAWTPSSSATTIRLLDWKPPPWPGLDWEEAILGHASHPGLPRCLGRFTADGYDYLIEDAAEGRPFWDAWDDDQTTLAQRYTWLIEATEIAQALFRVGAMPEALRPEQLVISASGRVLLAGCQELLPLTQPEGVPPAAPSFYTPPELTIALRPIDPRCVLYSLGAMLYALHVGRDEVPDATAASDGPPPVFWELFPEAHPGLVRLIGKTFCVDPQQRFPSEDAHWYDASGFADLLQGLIDYRDALEQLRFEVAGWSSTGMVRSSNEDAFAIVSASEARCEGGVETVLIALADGMGGAEAGEVAAALAVQSLRQQLLQRPPLARLQSRGLLPPPVEPGDLIDHIRDALIEANHEIYEAAQASPGRRGMGCTAEIVMAHGTRLVVGHVGDSRTYRWHRGRLEQITHDQTLVARLFELGHLTEEEAEFHPRRAELQQALGGRPTVDPELISTNVEPGDWVLVCSDGLTNTLRPPVLAEVLEHAPSAESAARRLVNLANAYGANDNVTVAVLRVWF